MARKAIVRTSDGLVVNVILLEEGATWSPPEGHEALDALNASPGDTWDGKMFLKPAPVGAPGDTFRDEFAKAWTQGQKLEVIARYLKLV